MKATKTTALILTLLIAASAQAFGQTYAAPRELPIERLVKQNFREYFGRDYVYPALIAESFYPIGWSKDGKFAYYTEPVDEACGCYYAKLVIQDLLTDKVIWKFDYEQGGQDDNGKSTEPGNIRELWKKNQKLFSEKLAENGIVASRSAMLAKTFTVGGKSYTAKLVEKLGKNPEEDYRRVDYYTVTLSSPRLGSKKLFTSEDNTKEEYWFMLNAGLIGVLKSPYENRVAIIAIEVLKGYEGPPHTGDIQIVGADLTSGFGKK